MNCNKSIKKQNKRTRVPLHPSTHHEDAAASIARVEGEVKAYDRRADAHVVRPLTLRVVGHLVEDELRLVVAGEDHRAQEDEQGD